MKSPVTPPADERFATTPVAVVALIEERLEVATVVSQTGSLRVRVEAPPYSEAVTLDLARETYRAVTIPVGTPADQQREPYHDGDDLVIPVYEERLVVERRLYLKEEVRLTRVRQVDHEVQQVPLRRERAIVERRQGNGEWVEIPTPQGAPFAGVPASPAGDTEPR